jgi:hypothetical protein
MVEQVCRCTKSEVIDVLSINAYQGTTIYFIYLNITAQVQYISDRINQPVNHWLKT